MAIISKTESKPIENWMIEGNCRPYVRSIDGYCFHVETIQEAFTHFMSKNGYRITYIDNTDNKQYTIWRKVKKEISQPKMPAPNWDEIYAHYPHLNKKEK